MAGERKLFTKEKFCEGNRQKWLIVFLAYLTIIMSLDAFHLLKDVTPYLTFLTFLAGAFILGYSGTETMKLFRASSVNEDQNIIAQSNQNNTLNENKNINVSEQFLTNNAKESDYNIQNIDV
jgi:ribosome-associated toxin RatA of RatAB toxin-antitoxin module